ncbi:MAG TPA: Gfo/Idh/MocA family oxidoreductase [Pseudonocardiaceae bacterium]
MRQCRIGFVGAGNVAARHARHLASLPEVRLVAVSDPVVERCTTFAARYGMRAVGDLESLLAQQLDAVYVCVPPFAHGTVEERIAAAGAAVFVEKPLGVDASVPEQVRRALERAGVVTAVGHHWRYSAAVRRAQDLLAGRRVRLVTGAWLDKLPPVPWWSRRSNSGGQVVEQAVHVLDLARVLVGEVTEVYATADPRPPRVDDADVDGATAATLRFACGAVGTLAATCLLGWKHRAGLEIYAEELALTVTEEGIEVHDGDGVQRFPVCPDEAKLAADRAFVAAVLGRGDGVLVPYGEALRTHHVACAITRSVVEGRPVRPEG